MEDDGNEPGMPKPGDSNFDLENIPNNEVVDSSIDVSLNSAPDLEPESSKPDLEPESSKPDLEPESSKPDLEPEGSNPESSKTPRLQQRPEVGHKCSRKITLFYTVSR